jgi:hypothetical protein
MAISHLSAALLFALFTSVVFGITSRNSDRGRLLYGLWVFGLFVMITFTLAWLMYLLRR